MARPVSWRRRIEGGLASLDAVEDRLEAALQELQQARLELSKHERDIEDLELDRDALREDTDAARRERTALLARREAAEVRLESALESEFQALDRRGQARSEGEGAAENLLVGPREASRDLQKQVSLLRKVQDALMERNQALAWRQVQRRREKRQLDAEIRDLDARARTLASRAAAPAVFEPRLEILDALTQETVDLERRVAAQEALAEALQARVLERERALETQIAAWAERKALGR